MTTETQQTIIDNTAQAMGISRESVVNLFDCLDQIKAQHGEQWRTALPEELMQHARNETPWAIEVLQSMVDGTFGALMDR